MSTIIECSENKAYEVSQYEYQNHSYLSISRMYKKKGDTEWSRGKGVAFQIDTEEDIDVIRKTMRAIKKELSDKLK